MYIETREGQVRVKQVVNNYNVIPEEPLHTDNAFMELSKKADILDEIINAVWHEESSKISNRNLATIVRHLVKPYIDSNKEAVIELIQDYKG